MAKRMMLSSFVGAIQRKVAVSAIPASAMRGQGAAGVVHAARDYLAALPLEETDGLSETTYCPWLDAHTDLLKKALPRNARRFGTARKALNLFLRDALYNRYLSSEFNLSALEYRMEVPLDSITASELVARDTTRALPSWPGVRELSARVSRQYQELALWVASTEQIARVHLDAYWWAAERKPPAARKTPSGALVTSHSRQL